ncbi:MAG: efflux RND transporter periplasmic adaptor subunit [Bryobacteraceae bacterium]|jgi:cobalt-zinc-cadmium efflux system membrane fusion protein|nr:efflux RND transporter periplasmic adaptor subunit [Bryobacteraceae bacterium]
MIVLIVALFGACGKRSAVEVEGEPKKAKAQEAAEPHRDNYIEEANVVELAVEAQRRAGVEVAPLAMGAAAAEVLLTGSVQPIDSKVSEVRPLARGRVTQVSAKLGDRVQTGQVLAVFDNIEAGELASQHSTAQAELQRLRVQQANAQRQAERSRSLVSIGAVPAKDAENAEAEVKAIAESVRAQEAAVAGIASRLTRFGVQPGADPGNATASIRAPFSGVVVKLNVAPGAVIDPTMPLFSIADLSSVYVEAQVFEKDLGRIRTGQPTQVRFEAYPGETFTGRVVSIRDILDPQTRTAGVRIEMPNPANKLRLEMFATVELPTLGTHPAFTVPTEAVQTINRRPIVFIKQDALHFAAREVVTVGEGLTKEIVSGVKEGELVVVKGAYQLKSVFLSRQTGEEHEH